MNQEHQENIGNVTFPSSAVVAVSHQMETASGCVCIPRPSVYTHGNVQSVTDFACGILGITRGGAEGIKYSRTSQLSILLAHQQFCEIEDKFYFRLHKVFSIARLF